MGTLTFLNGALLVGKTVNVRAALELPGSVLTISPSSASHTP